MQKAAPTPCSTLMRGWYEIAAAWGTTLCYATVHLDTAPKVQRAPMQHAHKRVIQKGSHQAHKNAPSGMLHTKALMVPVVPHRHSRDSGE